MTFFAFSAHLITCYWNLQSEKLTIFVNQIPQKTPKHCPPKPSKNRSKKICPPKKWRFFHMFVKSAHFPAISWEVNVIEVNHPSYSHFFPSRWWFSETKASQVSSEGPSQLPAPAAQLAAQLGATALLLVLGQWPLITPKIYKHPPFIRPFYRGYLEDHPITWICG